MAKILVVDDEPQYLHLLNLILKADGHEVQTTETGGSAVEIGQRFLPDVLLADWKLKNHLTGLDVARQLHAANQCLAMIIMTGYSTANLKTEAVDIPDLHIIEKPFGADTVRTMIREAVEAERG